MFNISATAGGNGGQDLGATAVRFWPVGDLPSMDGFRPDADDQDKQKPRRSGVCVSAVASYAASFLRRPAQPSNPRPRPIIA